MSADAAFARLSLALCKEDQASVAAYINEHSEQLLQHLDWRGIYSIEIEMLAGAGQTSKAEERLGEAILKGLSELEITRLRGVLAESSGADPIALRLDTYKESKSILDLRNVVSAYEDARDWDNACEYGKKLLDMSGDLTDARRYFISLYRIQRYDEALEVLNVYPSLFSQDDFLRELHVRILIESGRMNEAPVALQELRQIRDTPEARQLQIDLAVFSGDWESLQSFVEDEWNSRCDRTAEELLRAGQIAQHIDAGRKKELVKEAASRAVDDPEILVGCFQAASAGGWENSIEVHQWMGRAVAISGEDGPAKVFGIEEIFERKPDWERREVECVGVA